MAVRGLFVIRVLLIVALTGIPSTIATNSTWKGVERLMIVGTYSSYMNLSGDHSNSQIGGALYLEEYNNLPKQQCWDHSEMRMSITWALVYRITGFTVKAMLLISELESITPGAADDHKLTYGNLNNQKISFMSAIIASKQLSATFVIPKWFLGRRHFAAAGKLWDMDHLLKCAAEDQVSLLFPGASESGNACSLQKKRGDINARLADFKRNITRVLCVSSKELFFDLWKQDLTKDERMYMGGLRMHKVVAQNRHFAEARKWLIPSQHLVEKAREILSELNPDKKGFYAVQLRFEKDFVRACSFWPRFDDLMCMVTAEETIQQLERHAVPHGSLLYLFPPQSAHGMATLCQGKFSCIARTAVSSGGSEYNVQALLDYTISLNSAGAFGNIYSTMGVELVASIQAQGKPAWFVNPPCPEGTATTRLCP